MSNPNFVNDLVMMAKAFEELPIVQKALEQSEAVRQEQLERIQHLELKLIDRANELDAAHAATRKAEVERDHAERMFLETDDRLNAFRRLVQAFNTDVKSLVQATEHEAKPEPVTVQDTSHHAEQAQTQAEGQGDVDPIASMDSTFVSPSVSTPPAETQTTVSSGIDPGPAIGDAFTTDASEGVSVQADPTPAQPSTIDGTTTPTEDTNASDDVGYHNEPQAGAEHGWAAWDRWCSRMNAKYGPGQWPARPIATA